MSLQALNDVQCDKDPVVYIHGKQKSVSDPSLSLHLPLILCFRHPHIMR
jgi:hypothetical protein